MWRRLLLIAIVVLAAVPPRVARAASRAVAPQLTFLVNGIERHATVFVPAGLTGPAPLVLAFHGRGGTGDAFERTTDFQRRWPAAIVVYPDGLPGRPGSRTDPRGRRSGWQVRPGDVGDADVTFYDELLADLTDHLPVDPDRIYLVGFSNGSRFVSLLLALRGESVAATAHLSGPPGDLPGHGPARSMFLAIGRADPIFPYAEQRQSVRAAERHLGVEPPRSTRVGSLTRERGRGNLELVVDEYSGGHQPPDDVAGLVVSFFQAHTRSRG